jgi:hypothetical protein
MPNVSCPKSRNSGDHFRYSIHTKVKKKRRPWMHTKFRLNYNVIGFECIYTPIMVLVEDQK